MDLQDQPGLAPGLGQGPLAAHHRHLDDVGRGALDHRVDREALAQPAGVGVARAQLGDRPATPHQGRHVALLLGSLDDLLAEGADGGEALQVAGDEFLALFAGDVEPVGEAEAGQPVDDPEVDHLRLRALADVDLVAADLEDLGGGGGVDVFAGVEDVFQHRLVGDVGEHPQLDLAVVGGEQLRAPPRRRSRRGPGGRSRSGSGCSAGWGWCWRGGRWSSRPG